MLTRTVTSALNAINCLVYILAVNNGHVVAASLGYFLNPLVNVLLGFAILKERLGRVQWAAVALAAIGVAILAASALNTLWISLALAGSFAFYGLRSEEHTSELQLLMRISYAVISLKKQRITTNTN